MKDRTLLDAYPFRCLLSLKPLLDHISRVLKDPEGEKPCALADVDRLISEAPELAEPIRDPEILTRHRRTFQSIMSLVFPVALWDSEALGAVVPFSIEPFFVSPLFRRLFLNEDGSLRGRINLGEEQFNRGRAIRAYIFILEQIYGIRQEFHYPVLRIVQDPETGLERYFRMRLDLRFVEARPKGAPKTLDDAQRRYVLDHITEPERLREILPPEAFELHGFTMLQAVDVTTAEVLSALERDLIDQESVISRTGFLRLQERLRTLFGRPNLVAGLTTIHEERVLLVNTGCQMNHGCIFADSLHIPLSRFRETVFGKAVGREEILRVPDILEDPDLCRGETAIVQKGVRSILIAPLMYQGRCIGTLDLGSFTPGDLGPMEALVMTQIQPIFAAALKRALDELEHQIQGIIKKKCTAVHPAVEWRFRKAALRHLEKARRGEPAEMEPIVFRDVYPLYGISDIRGSATARNRAVQGDLLRQLQGALEVVQAARKVRPLLSLEELAGRIQERMKRLGKAMGTGDELAVISFLREEVESLFPHLQEFGPGVLSAVDAYREALDPQLETVYRLRRDFEESVSGLTGRLAAFLDAEEARMQAIYPHYFERHRTDGIDYLIYVGGSMLEKVGFNRLYLQELRLWQLKLACGLAREAARIKASLKVPLEVAHLVLIQDTPLSIRFRFDEKRFDVDGAYDIRHEIIKTRLDKAEIRGTRERLTQPGWIAVVYSQPEEATEVEAHLRFLAAEGYVNGRPQSLDLEDLPAVQGLRALRVKVAMESP